MLNVATPSGRRDHENNFNFLRLVFASLVILAHSYEIIDGNRDREPLNRIFGTLSFGDFAVDGFFLLSGFLITKSWVFESKPILFLSKRILRIYPGYLACIAICVLIVGPLASNGLDFLKGVDYLNVIQKSLQLIRADLPPVFAGMNYPTVNGALWTIRPEFNCYLFVLALGVVGIVKRRWLWLAITLALAVAILLKALHFPVGFGNKILTFENQMYRFALFFFAGACFFLFRDRIKYDARLAGVAFLALAAGLFSSITTNLVLASAGGYLLFYFAFRNIPALAYIQRAPDVSYGLYLYGWPIQALLIWYFPSLHPLVIFIVALMGGLVAGYLSWNLIEKPCLRFKPRRSASSTVVKQAA